MSANAATPTQVQTIDTQVAEINQKMLDASPIYSFCLSSVVLTKIAPGTIHATLPLSAPHINSKSILHGSVTATIIDWIGGLCVASASSNPLSANRGVSVDIHVSYTGGARLGEELLIVGSLDKLGKRMAFVRVEIRARKLGSEDEGSVVATGSHTKFVG